MIRGGVGSDFAALNSGKRNEHVQLYAFDMLAGDDEDHRRLPLRCARPTSTDFSRATSQHLQDYEKVP